MIQLLQSSRRAAMKRYRRLPLLYPLAPLEGWAEEGGALVHAALTPV